MQRKRTVTSVLKDLRWDDVRLFLALARTRTVGAAAKTLGVDASTVSRRLVALEEALGASLFDRGRDGIAATKAAEDLLPVAEEMELVAQRFAHAAEGLEREVSGLVRITSPADVAEVLLAPILEELLSRHPKLRVALEPGEALLDLARREADVALRVVRPTSGDLIVTRLAAVRWVAAAAPELARSLGTVRAFGDVPWVGWGERHAHVPAAVWLRKHVRGDGPVVSSDSLRLQLATVAAGVGVALVPEPSVAWFGLSPIRLAPGLREAAAAWPTDELFLVTHRALRDVPRVRAVWDFILERHAPVRDRASRTIAQRKRRSEP
jgi:DNA-binding transcriptional LysR family regulator